MRGVNAVEAGAIRVDADEVTYNLHILVRYELERELLGGRLAVADLPEAWNARYTSYLGYTPKNDLEGVMQDIHWAWGEMGYFATYTLGNLYSAAIAETMRAELDLDELMAAGNFEPDPAVAARAHPLEGQHPRGRRPDARGDGPPPGPRGLHAVPARQVQRAVRHLAGHTPARLSCAFRARGLTPKTPPLGSDPRTFPRGRCADGATGDRSLWSGTKRSQAVTASACRLGVTERCGRSR